MIPKVKSRIDPSDWTWEQQKAQPQGTILYDDFDGETRFIVVRGPAALCAYVGIPEGHPLAGLNEEKLDISCHGGLTFGKKGGRDPWSVGFWWYGWDYGHAGDEFMWTSDIEGALAKAGSRLPQWGGRRWLVKDVIEDAREARYQFRALMHKEVGVK